MNNKPIYISRTDHVRLKQVLKGVTNSNGKSEAASSLETELARATVLDPASVPDDLVSLNSRVTVRDLETNDVEAYTLSLPHEAGRGESVISILAPIGIALLGYSAGDEIAWKTPGGVRRMRIESVAKAQPRSAIVPPYFPEHLLGRQALSVVAQS